MAFVISVAAFVLNWLTLDGAVSAHLFGTIAYGLGGLSGALPVLFFFISGSLLSKNIVHNGSSPKKNIRRDGDQVWANGFWFALSLIIYFFSKHPAFLAAAISSLAATTADTWATELGGNRIKGKTVLISTLKTVNPGTDGGISVGGSLSAIAGSILITLTFWVTRPQSGFVLLFIIAISGVVGCFADSWFGARIQGKKIHQKLKPIFNNKIEYVDNNMVNWLAAGSSAILSFILIIIVG